MFTTPFARTKWTHALFTFDRLNAGKSGIRCLADGWTIVTADHSLSAQWEHTVLVTNDGYEVMTQSAGTPAPPPALD